MADVLGKQPRPSGPRLTILTNAGGPGVLATDALIANGGALASLSPATLDALNGALPTTWSHGNPIDILGDARPERLSQALAIAMADEQSDGLLVIYTPQGSWTTTTAAEAVRDRAPHATKPILASWMGGASVDAGQAVLETASIPTFPYPDSAARIFTHMWRYTYNLRGLYETPTVAGDASSDASRRVADVMAAAQAAGRTLLSELESKTLLSAHGIPVVETQHAATEEEAVAHAEAIGYPVVLKLHSLTVTHKTDVGGVRAQRDGRHPRFARRFDAFRHPSPRRPAQSISVVSPSNP